MSSVLSNAKSKSAWRKPQLIVILRNHPQETVLTTDCKHPGLYGPGLPGIPGNASCANNNGQGQCQASNNKS